MFVNILYYVNLIFRAYCGTIFRVNIRRRYMGTFFEELLVYSCKYIIMLAVAVGGVFLGVHFRKKKDSKEAVNSEN